MKILKASNKNGQRVIDIADRCVFSTLSEMYQTFSQRKQDAYNHCLAECAKDGGFDFGVGSANNFGFCATWCYMQNGHVFRRVETSKNTYIVDLMT